MKPMLSIPLSRAASRAAGALALSAALSSGLVAQEGLPLQLRTLENGLDVIVIENPLVPIVTVELDVKNGSFTEPPDYDGLSHLYEHMFFKANESIPSQERYLERVNELGGIFNGTTSTERVNYFLVLGVDSLAAGMQFMEDAIRSPLFLEEELVRERVVVIGEYDRAESTPSFHLGREMDRLLWTPEFYSRKNPIGARDVILSTTPDQMREIQRRYYVPNNTALIVAGAVTASEVFELAERIYGDWPRGDDPFATPAPDPPPLASSRAVVVEQPVGTVTVEIQWQGPSVDDDPRATYVADLVATVLSNPTSAFQKALVESGLAFGAGFSYYTQRHVGPVSVAGQTSPDRAVELHRALLAEVEKLGEPGYVTPEQLESAKTQVRIGELYAREQASEWAHTVGFWWAVSGLDYYARYVEEIGTVSELDIAEFARTYLIGKPSVSGVLISPEARAAVGLTDADLLAGVAP
jgi:zinc protease